jgi:hypothetical protein
MQTVTTLINRFFGSKDLSAFPTKGEFVKGINFNDKAITVDGYPWIAYSRALAEGLSVPDSIATETGVKPEPGVNRSMKKMLNTVVCKRHKLEISQSLPNGSYEVYLWIMENYASNHHEMDVILGGKTVDKGIAKLEVNKWVKYGPYATTVTDGSLNLALLTTNPERDAHLMGMAIFKV